MRISVFFFTVILTAGLAAQDVELVVTATKEPAPADTLPVGVTVLGPEELKDKATVSDALESTLAVRTSTLVPGQPALESRGFGANGSGRMSFLIDGVPQNNPDMSSPPLDLIPVFALERVEIMDGPASALYGDGAVAGAVNLVTRIPSKWEAQASTTLVSNLTNHQAFSMGAPVEKGGFLLSLQRDQGRSSRNRSDTDQYQGWTKFSYPLGRGEADQDLSVWLSVARATSQLPGGLTSAQFQADPDQALNRGDETTRTETKAGAVWSWKGDGGTLTVPLSGSFRLVRTTMASYNAFNDGGLASFNLEPRFSAEVGRMAGADLEWSGGAGLTLNRLAVDRYPDAAFSTADSNYLIQRWTGSVWNRWQASWNSRWYASVLVRAEASRTSADSAQSSSVNGRKDFWPLSGQAGVAWLPFEATKLGFQLSRVYRYPSVDEMIYYSGYGSDRFYGDIDPEVGHGATVSASSASGWLRAAVSATILRMENEVTISQSGTRNENSGPAWHSSGLVSAEAGPVSGARVGGQYDFEWARFASGVHEGKEIPLIPASRGRLWARWDWDLVGGVEIGWTLISPFRSSGDLDNTLPLVSARQSVDLSLSLNLGTPDLVLRISGKNLTDDRTPTYVDSYVDTNPLYSSTTYYPVEGRTFAATLSWKL